MVLVAVTSTSREEVDWITEESRRICPEAWERFPPSSDKQPAERTIEAYACSLSQGAPHDRASATRAWIEWEGAVLSLDPNYSLRQFGDVEGVAFATLVTHYWSNDGFLRNGSEIISNMARIAEIPDYLRKGRMLVAIFLSFQTTLVTKHSIVLITA